VVYPRTVYTDLNSLRLLASFGGVETAGTSTRETEKLPLSNSAVFLTHLYKARQSFLYVSAELTRLAQGALA
jgi:hypothetical protein